MHSKALSKKIALSSIFEFELDEKVSYQDKNEVTYEKLRKLYLRGSITKERVENILLNSFFILELSDSLKLTMVY